MIGKKSLLRIFLIFIIARFKETNGYGPLMLNTNSEEDTKYPNNNNNNNNNNYEKYDFILPTKRITSCPTFLSLSLQCQDYHLIAIDSITFSPMIQTYGECIPDRTAECSDKGPSLDYIIKECSSKESCNLLSYQIRSRTYCPYQQVINIEYKCVPTWEVKQVTTTTK
jgi:hypothetical protein